LSRNDTNIVKTGKSKRYAVVSLTICCRYVLGVAGERCRSRSVCGGRGHMRLCWLLYQRAGRQRTNGDRLHWSYCKYTHTHYTNTFLYFILTLGTNKASHVVVLNEDSEVVTYENSLILILKLNLASMRKTYIKSGLR